MAQCWGSTWILWLSGAITAARRSYMTSGNVLKLQLSPLLVALVQKYFQFTASLALQILGFNQQLWLSGAVTQARCPEKSGER